MGRGAQPVWAPRLQGHPLCRFCKKRFYGDGELFTHMEREHFKCHLCHRPDAPNPVCATCVLPQPSKNLGNNFEAKPIVWLASVWRLRCVHAYLLAAMWPPVVVRRRYTT